MEDLHAANGLGNPSARVLQIDISAIVTRVTSRREARALPVGCVVGDQHGGLTFTDAIASALETRSLSGWQEIHTSSGETWTVIVVNR